MSAFACVGFALSVKSGYAVAMIDTSRVEDEVMRSEEGLAHLAMTGSNLNVREKAGRLYFAARFVRETSWEAITKLESPEAAVEVWGEMAYHDQEMLDAVWEAIIKAGFPAEPSPDLRPAPSPATLAP